MLLPELNEWQTEFLRLTLFTNSTIGDEKIKWWGQLTNGAISESQINKSAPKEFVESGQYRGGILELKLSHGRIDCVFIFSEAEEQETIEKTKFKVARELFVESIERWITNLTNLDVNRIAIGYVLNNKVNSREDAYEVLQKLIPSFHNIADYRDFHLQINNPIAESNFMSGLNINRLVRYSAHRKMAYIINGSIPQKIEGVHLCRVDVDINSDSENTKNLSTSDLQFFIKKYSEISALC